MPGSAAWSRAHAERLLWRAGFGASPAELDHWAGRSRQACVDWLIRGGPGPHGGAEMVGPEPTDEDGNRLDPGNEWGHDQVWWLDRMVRSQRPLVEKMTLFWHDHFATRDQDTPLMLAQNRTLRTHALGSFRALLRAMTRDPAMQGFLSLVDSDKNEPNENFARELLELFTLGVGGGYSERDVREAARALTGFVHRQAEGRPLRVGFDPAHHDAGLKRVLGRRGHLDANGVLDAAIAHRAHAPYLVGKLWSFFVSAPPSRDTKRALVRVYARSGRQVAPVVRAILMHDALYDGLDRPAMVKAPVVLVAGMHRMIAKPVNTASWSWICGGMGQTLFSPPSVAGWDQGTAWLSSSAMRSRMLAATYITRSAPVEVPDDGADRAWSAEQQVAAAREAVGRPWTSPHTDAELLALAQGFLTREKPQRDGKPAQHIAVLTQSALRHLLLSGPDAQLH